MYKEDFDIEDDKLTAVAGYARSKQKELEAGSVNNRYLAGLWEKEIANKFPGCLSKAKHSPPRPPSQERQHGHGPQTTDS
jgi:hypothetical protein